MTIDADIRAIEKALDGEIAKVHTDCQQCGSFTTFYGDDPVLDALIHVHKHEHKLGHTDFDVCVEVIKQVEEIDVEITVGDTVESA
jgi:hypothetical protein